ncbi:EamA family transporter [Pseudoalteromonas sp. GCY]|uniref:DMT family transporter n=1 Tax=Pseudoalteromonas sp. GCY TaxID=2003316 RepID=UPI000BFF0A57|nr:DMT family transporter [Pseudoalteromonas sp. GCY]PHI35270.1 EamA family transporter [Pseudoalteromonas sp. GCY]QQQ64676.1 DMT family transporter [Pseudoalteromonas sp. GCY]
MKGFLGLVLLAAIWGGSFLFMKVAAGVLGPAVLIEFRVLFGALTLAAVALVLKRNLHFWQYKKHFLILGLFNSALPFMLFAYAVQTLDASMLSILNSTAPFWGVLISVFWLKVPTQKSVWLGCGFGIAGVITLVGLDSTVLDEGAWLPIIATLCATLSYAVASHYTKTAPKISAFNHAHGNLWGSALLVLPFIWFMPMRETPDSTVISAVVGLGILCTGFAYILYFKLVEDLGAASALSVTFLIPVFGILWGHLFLQEQIGANTILGSILVLLGVSLVTGLQEKIFPPKAMNEL